VCGELVQAEPFAARQWVIRGCHEIQRVPPYRDGLQRGVGFRGEGDDRQLHIAAHDLVVSLLRVHEIDIERNVRIGLAVAAQHRWQPVQADVVAGAQAQSTRDSAGQVVDGLPGLLQMAGDGAGVGQKCVAGFGQGDAPPDPVEQAGTELLFQGGNPLADGGLGEVQGFRSGGK
jgi:hypothetical protein